METETILITGGAGFIGSHLVNAIRSRYPMCKIVIIDNMNDYYDVSLKQQRLDYLLEKCNIEFFPFDISDKYLVDSIFKEYKPSIVVNLAAQAGVRYSITNPDVYINSNIVGFYNILEACRRYGVKHLVYASSSSVYGQNKVPFSESDKTDKPVSLYAATKKSNELFAETYSHLYGIPCTGLRFFTVYGPNGRPDMAYFSFANKLMKGEKIKLFNYGKCYRDFTYIDDVVEVLMRVLETSPGEGELHKVYNVGCGNPVSLKVFAKTLFEQLARVGVVRQDCKVEDYIELVKKQDGDVDDTFADNREIRDRFGYKPQTSLTEGLAKFADWFLIYSKSV